MGTNQTAAGGWDPRWRGAGGGDRAWKPPAAGGWDPREEEEEEEARKKKQNLHTG